MAAGDLTTLANVKQWLGLTGLAISAITNANPAVCTLATQPQVPLINGQPYSIEGAVGMALPAATYVVTTLSPTTFSIPVNSTALGTYTGGAIVGITDNLLSRLISAVSASVQSWLGRTIASATYTETRNGNNSDRMPLMNFPVLSVTSLVINGQTIPQRPPLGSGYTATITGMLPLGWVNDQYMIYVDSGQPGCAGFPKGIQNVVITYSAGYASTPLDVEQAVIDIIGDLMKYMQRIGKTSQGIEGQTTAFVNTAMPVRAQQALFQYKQVAPVVV